MTKIKSEKIELVDIDSIIPNPKNMNQHSEDQIERLAKLIEFNGFREPLIISNRSGFLICGHGRYSASKKLGMKQVPVCFQDFENEAEEYQFAVAHNAIASWSNLDLEAIKFEIPNLDIDPELLALKIDLKDLEIIPEDYSDKNREIDTENFGNDLEHTCPKCGFEFNE